MRNRIGIFGGTFDPIHLGHLRVAEEVRELLSLDKVIFVPAYIQPLKEAHAAADVKHRLEMARLAVANNPDFEVDDCEARREGSSYTVDTLDQIHKRDQEARLFFLLGSDAWMNIALWRDYMKLFELAQLVVMSRPGYEAAPPEEILPLEAARRLCYDGERYGYSSGDGVRFVQVTWLDISGTLIRKMCREGKSIKYFVPTAVEAYISKEKLYGIAGSSHGPE